MESLDMLANNIANAATGGYKADREFYRLYISSGSCRGRSTLGLPLIETAWMDLSQGIVHCHGESARYGASGKGFFAVNAPGGTLYTRNGNFSLAADGKLVTGEGYPVRIPMARP